MEKRLCKAPAISEQWAEAPCIIDDTDESEELVRSFKYPPSVGCHVATDKIVHLLQKVILGYQHWHK